LPDPNLPLFVAGMVKAVARLPDGSVVIGGLFISVNGTPRSNLAKLLPDGALDAAWNPAPNEGVNFLVVDSSGNLYVGGSFWTIGGQNRIGLAKLSGSGTGAADPIWNPAASDQLLDLGCRWRRQ
jgi:hypothetical protein